MHKHLIKLYYSLKTSIGCLLNKVRYKIYLTQELLKRCCLRVEMLFLEVIPPRMGRFEGYRNSFFKSISFKKLLSFFEIFNVPFEHLSKVTLIKIGIFYSLFYIFLFQLVLYNTAGLLFVLWFLVFGQIKKIKYSQKLYIRLMQSNPNKYSIKLLLLLFVTPCRIIIFINIFITTDITIFDLLPLGERTDTFDTFFCFDLECHLYDTFKIKKNINIKSLNHLIILFLFLNVSLLLVRPFIYYFGGMLKKYTQKKGTEYNNRQQVWIINKEFILLISGLGFLIPYIIFSKILQLKLKNYYPNSYYRENILGSYNFSSLIFLSIISLSIINVGVLFIINLQIYMFITFFNLPCLKILIIYLLILVPLFLITFIVLLVLSVTHFFGFYSKEKWFYNIFYSIFFN